MKKAVLILVSIAAGFLLLGFLIVAATGFRIPGNVNTKFFPWWVFRVSDSGENTQLGGRLSQPRSESKTAPLKQIDSINLELYNTDLTVEKTNGDSVTLSYESIYDNEWNYSFQNGELSLKSRKWGNRSFEQFVKNFADENDSYIRKATLSVPEGSSVAFSLSDVNGSVAAQGLAVKSLKIDTVNASVNISDLTSQQAVKLENVNAKANFKNLKAPELDASDLVNGECSLSAPQVGTIDAGDTVNATVRLSAVGNTDDYAVDVKDLVNSSAVIDGKKITDDFGNGKYKVRFGGVNSKLYIDS